MKIEEWMSDPEIEEAMKELQAALDLANKELEKQGEEPVFNLSMEERPDGGINIYIGP